MLFGIANGEDPDQNASLKAWQSYLSTRYLGMAFGRQLMFEIVKNQPYSKK